MEGLEDELSFSTLISLYGMDGMSEDESIRLITIINKAISKLEEQDVENIIVREEWMEDVQEFSRTYLTDSLYELNYLKMGAPYYYSIEEDIPRDTDQYAPSSGWIIVNAQSDSGIASPIEVIIEEQTITKMSCETGHWQTVVVPVMEGMTWRVAVPNPGDSWIEWHIKFIPCTILYNI